MALLMTAQALRSLLTAAALLLALHAPALAATWRVDPSQSKLAFTYKEDGKPAFGSFERFSGTGSFDPATPQNATLDLTIEVGSITLKDGVRSSIVKGETWFDAENIPTARFQLKKLTPLDKPGLYRADGVLTIKNFSRRVRPVVRLDIDGRTARARGKITFRRSHFRVGDVALSLFVEVSDRITVDFDVRARRR